MTAVVLVVILGVALFDVGVGVRLLASPRPFDANGQSTLWSTAGPGALAHSPELLTSLFRRLGAFSLHSGVATIVWALTARDEPVALLVLLATYVLTGSFFLHGDRRYFAGTRYFALKQAFGVVWALALVAQVVAVVSG